MDAVKKLRQLKVGRKFPMVAIVYFDVTLFRIGVAPDHSPSLTSKYAIAAIGNFLPTLRHRNFLTASIQKLHF